MMGPVSSPRAQAGLITTRFGAIDNGPPLRWAVFIPIWGSWYAPQDSTLRQEGQGERLYHPACLVGLSDEGVDLEELAAYLHA